MKVPDHKRRLREEEGGFTLPEMLVTMLLMIVVLFALYSIFDASIRVFSFGNDKVEATENARLGLAKMEREIRGAYPYDLTRGTPAGSNPDRHLLFTSANPSAAAVPPNNRINFGNEQGAGNQRVDSGEIISYYIGGTGNDTLIRSQGATTDAVVGPLPANGLRFIYLQGDGTTEVLPGGDESRVEIVRIRLIVNVDGRTQILTTDVDLRNRGI